VVAVGLADEDVGAAGADGVLAVDEASSVSTCSAVMGSGGTIIIRLVVS